jgi:hypothetical protein
MTTINDTNFHIAITDWSNNGSISIYGDISTWDTSGVTDMSFAFYNMTSFNEDISGWNMGNVTTTESMFQGATAFNQPIGNWNMVNVTNTQSMFQGATSFDQDISGWTMNNVINTQNMFQGATAFNQPIGNWNMEEVVNASAMFMNASSFNEDIDLWRTSELVNTNQMFQGASSFNKTIQNWIVINVTTMESMFQNATAFNKPLNLWNMRSVTNTQSMFEGASAFNQNISSWVLISLTDAKSMFKNATDFSQNLFEWGGLPDVNLLTDFSLNSNAILGSGPPNWITIISDNTSGLDVDDITKVRESIAIVSEGVPFMSGPRYGYISIDDHQTNSKSDFQVVYGDSVRDDNIIARINLAPRSIHTLSLRDAGMASLLNRTRTYQGPVNIQKLTVKLYDEYGRIIDLNNTDWSFTLEFEKEVKQFIESEKS